MSEPRLRPPRVLVAEDDTEMRNLVAGALQRDGYEVIEARDGQGVLTHVLGGARALPIGVDLLVSDIRMPFASGLEVVEALRAAKWRGPVVLMTAFGDEEARARATALGALLLDKPFALVDLRAAVRMLIAAANLEAL